MKVQINEYPVGFSVDLEAENQKDAAFIARFGLNSTKEIYYKNAFVHKDGSFSMTIALRANKRAGNNIERKL